MQDNLDTEKAKVTELQGRVDSEQTTFSRIETKVTVQVKKKIYVRSHSQLVTKIEVKNNINRSSGYNCISLP